MCESIGGSSPYLEVAIWNIPLASNWTKVVVACHCSLMNHRTYSISSTGSSSFEIHAPRSRWQWYHVLRSHRHVRIFMSCPWVFHMVWAPLHVVETGQRKKRETQVTRHRPSLDDTRQRFGKWGDMDIIWIFLRKRKWGGNAVARGRERCRCCWLWETTNERRIRTPTQKALARAGKIQWSYVILFLNCVVFFCCYSGFSFASSCWFTC